MLLGINDGHDAGVAIITKDGGIVFAANEERYSGVKQQWGFPHLSLAHAIDHLGLQPEDVTDIAFGFRGLVETQSTSQLESEGVGLTRRLFTWATTIAGPMMDSKAATAAIRTLASMSRKNQNEIREALAKHGLTAPRRFIDHHTAHAASAYYTSGFNDACVVTIDAGGDGLSGSLWHGKDGQMHLLETLPRIHSLGDFWLAVTLLCGFNPDRHGGKVTGLAAYTECPEALEALRGLYRTVPDKFAIRNVHYLFWKRLLARMKKVLAPFSREQIAYGAQRLLEELVMHLVNVGLKKTGARHVAVAGGVFANVRVNMDIALHPVVDDFFVHPHMGDGGTAAGAALYQAAQRYGIQPRAMTHAFLGTEAGTDLGRAVPDGIAQFEGDMDFLARKTAELIADNKVIGVIRGRMEYGPRALTNRTILYHPFDDTIMEWLNERLARTEFMPFAPVVAEEKAHRYFDQWSRGALASRFMTVCLPVTDLAREQAPAIVHKDGTARPQFVDRRESGFCHTVLEHFEQITGVAILINTSFNRHERPIIASSLQGLEELERGVVDALVLADRILVRE